MTTQQGTMSVNTRMENIRRRDTESIQSALQNLQIRTQTTRVKSQWEKNTSTMEEAYLELIKYLLNPGDEVILFGGYVRDTINCEKPVDFDVCIPVGYISVIKRSSKVKSLLLSGFLEEVNDRCYDRIFETVSYIVRGLDGRKIDFSYQTTDARIRSIDFTCNSLIYDVKKKSLCVNPFIEVDLFQTMQDIREKKLRFVHQPPTMREISQLCLRSRCDYYKLFSRYIKMVKRGWKLVDEQSIDIMSYSLKETEKEETCPITMENLAECEFVLKTSCGHMFDSEAILNALQSPRSTCPYCRSEVSGFLTE